MAKDAKDLGMPFPYLHDEVRDYKYGLSRKGSWDAVPISVDEVRVKGLGSGLLV